MTKVTPECWHVRNRELHNERRRQARKENPEKFKKWRKSEKYRKYGLTEEGYLGLYNLQEGKCAICSTFLPLDERKAPYIDHNHSTGEVRGLLCAGCNTGLGMFKDSPEILEAAVQYLKERGNY